MKQQFSYLVRTLALLLVLFGLVAMPVKAAPNINEVADDLATVVLAKAVEALGVDPALLMVSDVLIEDNWAAGYVVVRAVGDGAPDLISFVAVKNVFANWNVIFDYENGYTELASRLPTSLQVPEIVGHGVKDMESLMGEKSAWVEQPELTLPWASGEVWKLTGGPHNNSTVDNTRPWSSLDFSPGTTGSWKVRAAASGTVSISSTCKNFILIKHANGWETGYYHLNTIQVSNGQYVSAGTYLGKTSTESGCGGSAGGAHVHFSLRKSGSKQELNGRYVGGFYIRDGSAAYNGCLQRVSDGKKYCQWSVLPSNPGVFGLGIPNIPNVTSPNNTTVTGTVVNFVWTLAAGSNDYEIQIASDTSFATLVATATTTSTSYSNSSLFTGQYYWRVRGRNFSHTGNWSAIGSFYLQSDGTPPPPPPTPDPIVVNPSLTPAFGPICDTAWYKVSGTGYNGTHVYLTLNTPYSSQSTNSAKWTPTIPLSGRYKVEAYIGHHDPINWSCPTKYISKDTSDARYKIYYSGGSATKVIDQYPLDNQWATVGTFYFVTGTTGYVKLTDLNGESNLSRTISFNVIRFTWVGP